MIPQRHQLDILSQRPGSPCGWVRPVVWVLFAITAAFPGMVRANPTGGTVAGGAATIASPNASTVVVNQTSARTIINWSDFSIGSGELTKFIQPSAASAALNRVLSSDPSLLLGQLQANGQVFLINPNGIVVGQGASINTAGFGASTLNVSNAEFLAGGDLHLSGQSPAAIVNLGHINASQGDIYLVAQQVANSGTLTAPNGTVGLAAGTEVTLTQNGSEHVLVTAPVTTGGSGAAVLNSGAISAAQAELTAADGNLYALAINNTGAVRATGTQTIGGHLYLTATAGTGNISSSGSLGAVNADGSGGAISIAGGTAGGTLNVSGAVSASATSATGAGGQVTATAANVNLQAGAAVAADGGTKGGTVLIGGDIHGGAVPTEDLSATPIATAQQTTVAQGATISASGGQGGGSGSGGSVVVWSDQQTNFQGEILALGGAQGGNGGSAEVSSHQVLNYAGTVDLLAPQGVTGTLLLDPANVLITSADGTSGFDGFGSDATNTYTPSASSALSYLSTTDLHDQLEMSNVTVVTTNNGASGGSAGTITVDTASPISWDSSTSLTLTAASSMTINSSITQTGTSSGGNITLSTGAGSSNILTIAANTTVSTASLNAAITLQTDSLSFGSTATTGPYVRGTTLVEANNAGEVIVEPATSTNGVSIGFDNNNSSYSQIGASELNDIVATTLVIGGTAATSPTIVDELADLDTSSGDSLQYVTNLELRRTGPEHDRRIHTGADTRRSPDR